MGERAEERYRMGEEKGRKQEGEDQQMRLSKGRDIRVEGDQWRRVTHM